MVTPLDRGKERKGRTTRKVFYQEQEGNITSNAIVATVNERNTYGGCPAKRRNTEDECEGPRVKASG